MSENIQSVFFNEDIYNSLMDKQRSMFIYEWLSYLYQENICEYHSQIIEQLLQQMFNVTNSPSRILIGRNLARLLNTNNQSSLLIKTINHCIDNLRTNNEIVQLTSVVVIGVLYEDLSRFLDHFYEEIIQLLSPLLQNRNSQMRCEVLITLGHITNGLGPIGRCIHREIYHIAKTHLCDRTMSVRSSAATCLIALIHHNNFMYTNELEGNVTLGLRAFEGSNYQARYAIAKYLAILLANFQSHSSDRTQNSINEPNVNMTNTHRIKMEKMFNYLSEGFVQLKSSIVTNQVKSMRTIQNEVRIGITHTYLALIDILGTEWIEQNLSFFINHLLELVDNSQLSISHLDNISIRKCITCILRSMIDLCSNERTLFIVAKELSKIITRYAINQPMINSSSILTNNFDTSLLYSSAHSMIQSYELITINQFEYFNIEYHENILICTLDELSLLIENLEISTLILLQDSCNDLIETLFSISRNSSQSIRLSVAWCFHSIAIALPSFLTQLIDQCLEKIHELAKEVNLSNIDAMSGYGFVLQTLLGTVHQCSLGIPSQRVKIIFNFADDLLRTAITSTMGQEQSIVPRLILQRISTAWHLLSACCTIDKSLRKNFLPRLILLWRNVFPRSLVDFEQEKQRGDCLTWLLSFNQRSGALCSIISFLNSCLITKDNSLFIDLLSRIMNSLNNAIVILFQISNLIRQFGQQLKIVTIVFRLRLYELLLLIPSQFYEQYLERLERQLITEFTLVDSLSNTTTSLVKSICHDLLDNWLVENNHLSIEEQLNIHSWSSFGALEHDETYLYRQDHSHSNSPHIPEPLPIYVALIDSSIQLYSRIFTHISNVQHVTTFQSFTDAIKQSKDARQEAIQINILTAMVLSLKTLGETEQMSLWNDELKNYVFTLIIETLNHTNSILRCLAAEAFSHFIQILPDQCSISSTIQLCLNHLKESQDIPTRIGYSLALACVYRYADNISKEQYLNLFIPIFQTMMEDQSKPTMQIWALRGLILITDSSEDIDSCYIGSLIDDILQILLCKTLSQIDIHQFCGRLLNSLMLNMGSDLQTNTNSISKLRSSCLIAINLLQMHTEPVIHTEVIQALQQLYIAAPQYVDLSILIRKLIQGLTSSNLSLRKTCISGLCQLFRREAKQVHEQVKLLFNDYSTLNSEAYRNLEELLFSLLDRETETTMCSSIRNVLLNMLQTLENDDLQYWLQLCNDILASDQFDMHKVPSIDIHDQTTIDSPISLDKNSHNDDANSNNQLLTTTKGNSIYHTKSPIKWSTKIFAVHCMQNLIKYCEQTTQLNLHSNPSSSMEYFLVHFHVFISSSILACTSKHDSLRLAGFSLLKQIILISARLEENIDSTIQHTLKQYQRQISDALRSAFSRRTSPCITAQACDLCWIWILNYLAPDPHDLQRIHKILLSSLEKLISLQEQYNNQTNMIYHENAITMENLAILKLWADVYIFLIEQEKEKSIHHLLSFIQRELYILIHHWLVVLTDYASLMLSTEFHRTKNSYSIEPNIEWSSIIQASTHWLVEHHYALELSSTNHQSISCRQKDFLITKLLTSMNKTKKVPEKKEDIFIILITCCTRALSISISEQTDEVIQRILISFMYLLQSPIASSQINTKISMELLDVLHRLCSIRTDLKTQSKILKMLDLIFHLSSMCMPSITESDESLLFTSLKCIVSILLTYFPTIANDFQFYSASIDIDQDNMNNSHVIDFILSTLQLLDRFIQLFSTNQNFQNIFSVIIHLVLSISYVLLFINSDQYQLLLSTIIQIFEHLSHISINDKISHNAMMKIINFRDKFLEKNITDQGYFLRCLTLLIINCNIIPKQILDFYQKIFQDRDAKIHHQCLQCLEELFQSKMSPLRNQFIRIFSPLLFRQLKQTSDPQEIIQILKIFEKLLSIVDSSSRLHLASIIIPLFIQFLPDSTSSTIQIDEHLMLYITERLQYLSSIHPNEFTFVVQRSPDLQTKLSNVITTSSISIPLQMKCSNFTS